ncbi:O-methyltransferase [Mucilaginibacter sp.]
MQFQIQAQPVAYAAIQAATEQQGFTMPSELGTCALLCTLAASKPGGHFLELGTGTGLSTSWILHGMDATANLISIDNDEQVLNIAQAHLGADHHLQLINADGAEWIKANMHLRFSYIFADTWAGKYNTLDETLNMLVSGGFYIIDDMLPQSNWPDGRAEKAEQLTTTLKKREDLTITRLDWASGIIIAVKK